MNRTIQEDIKNIEKQGKPKFSFRAILKQLAQLFCDSRNRVEYLMMLLYFAQVNIYFFGLFNGSSLKRNGNTAQICMLWGISEVVGVQIGHRIQHYLSNKNGMILALSLIIFWNWVIKSYPWSEHMLLLLFMAEITCIGMTGNLIFTVFESRTNPKLLNIAMEFNICFGNLTTLACPVIARMHEPTPTVYSTFLCLLGIIVLLNLPPARDEQETLEQAIEKSLASVMYTHNLSDPSLLEKQMVMRAWRKSSSVQSSQQSVNDSD
jgi:predicted MFS family arabinose efflux permease